MLEDKFVRIDGDGRIETSLARILHWCDGEDKVFEIHPENRKSYYEVLQHK